MLSLYEGTHFKIEQNARYDNLDKFLESQAGVQFDEFQYIKPALETYVKIEMDGWIKNKYWDYAKVINGDGNVYYYFVTRHKWVSENTMGLTLALDTINTFWNDLSFTNKTHITRRFKNRFNVIHQGSSDTLVPIVDKFSEDIPNPSMYRTSISTIGDKHLWYIVQRTDYEANQVSKNPVTTYLLQDERIDVSNESQSLLPDDLIEGRAYFIEGSDDIRIIKALPDPTGGDPLKISYSADNAAQYLYFYRSGNEIRLKIRTTSGAVQTVTGKTELKLLALDHAYLQRADFDLKDSDNSSMGTNFDYDTKITFASYGGSFSVLSFDEWYKSNKTDTNLIKITCLPYCPIDLNKLKYGVDYDATAYGIRLINPNIEYKSLITSSIITLEGFDKATSVKLAQNYDLKYESKRYNSSYHTLKYVYDNNQAAFNLEDFNTFRTGSNNSESLDLIFYYNKEMSNSMAFRFDANYNYSTDYGEWLVCSKSLDVPYFTNEYLNYLRYGKAVDERNAGFNIAGTILSGVSTGVSTYAATRSASALAKLGNGLSITSAAIGLVSTGVSAVAAIIKARDSINAKIDAYKHQASQVNGTSDLSIFKAYGDNKLLKVEYDPPEELLTPILNYFRLFGYSTDEYAVPDFNTRYYSDFIIMEPDFAEDSIDSDYLDDFKARCTAGLRIYHYHDGYDLDCNYENWEVSLIG